MNFGEFVNDWWQEYIQDHKDDGHNLNEIFTQMGYNNDDLDEDGVIEDFLSDLDADKVFEFFFGYSKTAGSGIDGIPDTDSFMEDALMQAAKKIGMDEYSFTKEFCSDMAGHISGYSQPESFFTDLQHGCSSGMIGMLVYNADCKRIYIEHIDDMEEYKSSLEDDMGAIKNNEHLPHYTFMCWLCYEELGYNIARELFPNKF